MQEVVKDRNPGLTKQDLIRKLYSLWLPLNDEEKEE
jgi:hypothetical protein